MQEVKNRSAFMLKLIRIIYLVLCGLILTVGTSFYVFMHNYISKVNMVSPDLTATEDQPYIDTEIKEQEAGANQAEKAAAQERNTAYASSKSTFSPYSYYSSYISPYLNPAVSEENHSDGINSQQKDIDDLKESIKKNYEAELPLINDGETENILLLGYQHDSSKEIDDPVVMALLSIDRKNKKINTIAFQQDIYLQVPGEGNHRLAEAYLLGGVELLADTLKKNFKLRIDRYMQLDILIFGDIIDAIGGITLEVTKDDLETVNTCIRELNTSSGDPKDADLIKKAGSRRLNGKQALGYIWCRSLLGGKGEQSSQENNMIEAIRKQIYDYDLAKLHTLLDLILPKVTTNMTESELIALLLFIPSYQDYKINSMKVPVEGSYRTMYIDKKLVLGIDFSDNLKELKDKLADKAN